MAQAKKCDRCDTLYESYGRDHGKASINGIVTASFDNNSNYAPKDYIDLCPNCLRSFLKWKDEARRINAMVSTFCDEENEVVEEE